MSRVCDSIWAADGSIPPIATHGLALPTRPALLSIVALLRGAASITTSASRKRSRPPRGAPTAWEQRMELTPPKSDCAADALEPEGEWNTYLQAISSFMSGAGLEHVSVADYTAYDAASTGCNWRTPGGYGTLIAASLPHPIDLRLSTPVQSIELGGPGVALMTPVGAVSARAAILTVSTTVLAGSSIRLPPDLDAWRHAAARLPLGRDEKLCRAPSWKGLIDSWCKSFPTAASCERGADRRRRGHTWHA